MKSTQTRNNSKFIIFTFLCFLYGIIYVPSAQASTCVLSGNRVVVDGNILVKPIFKASPGTPAWPTPAVECVNNDGETNTDNKKAEYIFSLPNSGGTVTATVLVTASGVGTSYDFTDATNSIALSVEFGLDVWVPNYDNSGNIVENCHEYDRLIKQDTIIKNNKEISRLNGKTNLCMEAGYTRKDTVDYYPYDWTANQSVNGKKHRDPDAIIPGFKTSDGTYFVSRPITLTNITYLQPATNGWQARFMYQKEVEQVGSSFIYDQTTSVHLLENSKANGKGVISHNFLYGNDLSAIQTARFGNRNNNATTTFNNMRITQFVNKNWKGCAIDLTGDSAVQTYDNDPGTNCHSNKSDYLDMAEAMNTETGSNKQDYVVMHGYLDQAKSDVNSANIIASQFNGSTGTKSLYYMFFGALPFATPTEAWSYSDNGAGCNVNQKLQDQSGTPQHAPNPDANDGNWQLGDVRSHAFRTCFVKMAEQAINNGYDGIFLDGGHLWTSKAISNNGDKRFVGGVKATINYNLSWSKGRTLLLQELRDMIDGHTTGATIGIVSPVYTDNFHLVDFIVKEGAMFEAPSPGTGLNDAHTQKEFKLGSMFQSDKHSKEFKKYTDPVSGGKHKYTGGISAHINTYRRYFTTQQIFACKGPNRMLVQYCFSRIDNLTSKHDFLNPETRSNPKYAHIPENTGIYYENGDWHHNRDYPSIHYCEDASGEKVGCDQAGATDVDPYHHVDDPCLPSDSPCALQSDYLPPKKRQTHEAIQVVYDAFKLLQSPTPTPNTVYITKFGDDTDAEIENDLIREDNNDDMIDDERQKIVTMSSMSSIRFDDDDCALNSDNTPSNPNSPECTKTDIDGRLWIELSDFIPIYNETTGAFLSELVNDTSDTLVFEFDKFEMIENNTYIFADQTPINGWKWARHGFAWKGPYELISGSFDFSKLNIFSHPISYANNSAGVANELFISVRISLKDIKANNSDHNLSMRLPEIDDTGNADTVQGASIQYLGSTEATIDNRGNGQCIGSDNGNSEIVYIQDTNVAYFDRVNKTFKVNLRCEGIYTIRMDMR